MSKQGKLIVISGPSGVGKATLIRSLMEALPPNCQLSTSSTTRPPRDDETNGKEYHFVSKKQFEENVVRGEFLEHALYKGEYYGTSKVEVGKIVFAGKSLILEIDIQGSRLVKSLMSEASTIFIVPPGPDEIGELRKRLTERGKNEVKDIEERLAIAVNELEQINFFDHVVVNDDMEKAKGVLIDLVIDLVG